MYFFGKTLFGRSRCMLGPKLYSQLAADLGVACDISVGPECYEPLAGSPLRLPGRLSTQLCHQYPQKALEWRRGCNTQLAGLELCRSPTREGVFAPAETINMTLQELVQAGKRCQIPSIKVLLACQSYGEQADSLPNRVMSHNQGPLGVKFQHPAVVRMGFTV